MVRLVDLGYQLGPGEAAYCIAMGLTRQFAFFDTVSDTFMDFDGCQVFDSLEHFEGHLKTSVHFGDSHDYVGMLTEKAKE